MINIICWIVSTFIYNLFYQQTFQARLNTRSIFTDEIKCEGTSLIVNINREKFEILSFQQFQIELFFIITSMRKYWLISVKVDDDFWNCWKIKYWIMKIDCVYINKEHAIALLNCIIFSIWSALCVISFR